jgi:hypothetical protein
MCLFQLSSLNVSTWLKLMENQKCKKTFHLLFCLQIQTLKNWDKELTN